MLLGSWVTIPISAGDWPGFLGPNANGTSPETGLMNQWPESGPSVIWSRPVGTGYSAPSIRGNRLILHHRVGDEEIVESLDPVTGESRWRHSYGTSYVDPYGYNNGPRCTPLLTSERCFTFGVEGRLVCLRISDGGLIWQRDTAKDFDIPSAFFGVGSTPLLVDDLLIVMVGGQPDAGMVAFRSDTGETVWKSVGQDNWEGQPMLGWRGEREVVWKPWDKQASYASPVLANVHGRPTVFALMRQGLVSLEPATGKVLFSRWFRAQIEESVNAANPVVLDDRVFFSAAYYNVGSAMLRVLPDGDAFEEVWKGTSLEIHWTTPILHEGFLYAFSGRNEPDARFRCVEFETGRLMWDRDESWRRTNRTPDRYGRGSAILADEKLIVLGEGGLLGLFRVNPERPEELSRWQAPGMQYPSWTAPILSNRRLYLRGENRLICLDVAGREN